MAHAGGLLAGVEYPFCRLTNLIGERATGACVFEGLQNSSLTDYGHKETLRCLAFLLAAIGGGRLVI